MKIQESTNRTWCRFALEFYNLEVDVEYNDAVIYATMVRLKLIQCGVAW